jgi:hypothetical protein
MAWSAASWPYSSMPSATVDMPRLCPSWMIVLASALSSESPPSRSTNDRSILSVSTGNRRR